MTNVMHAPTAFLCSRRVVNAIYFVLPPLGLLFMFLSPFFSTKERLLRAAFTGTFLLFFATMGPELHAYLHTQVAMLAIH
ncbi:MAG TPA: hypothetical protein V6D47_03565 [Oscillatoriaceae cyanobacterium]